MVIYRWCTRPSIHLPFSTPPLLSLRNLPHSIPFRASWYCIGMHAMCVFHILQMEPFFTKPLAYVIVQEEFLHMSKFKLWFKFSTSKLQYVIVSTAENFSTHKLCSILIYRAKNFLHKKTLVHFCHWRPPENMRGDWRPLETLPPENMAVLCSTFNVSWQNSMTMTHGRKLMSSFLVCAVRKYVCDLISMCKAVAI